MVKNDKHCRMPNAKCQLGTWSIVNCQLPIGRNNGRWHFHFSNRHSDFGELSRVAFGNRQSIFIVWAIALLLCFAGCDTGSGLPTTHMQMGGQHFTLEMATTDAQQQTGLMHRDPMPDDHGMIFPFKDQAIRAFYNENVRFDIDVIFIDAAGKVVAIKQLQAYDAHTVSSDFPAQFVIELNRGLAAKLGLTPGSQVTLPKEVMAAAGK